ncbi:phosphoglycerate dehydrogenase [Rhabdobacter roseus]|uniref:Phosphoglycerate dehydrogenase-like enzyme n=1 Tax=Rhabdobacter roseus TaxID=1655419 RepID=A0A840TTC1_9BACT|nr:D-2-hydroxyacid dehydrogenase [Rhabdobacter roseus]MBB5286145.1 phosphoglycerate dehydrogenase-like enzyme [Rhabdobacter roseus]
MNAYIHSALGEASIERLREALAADHILTFRAEAEDEARQAFEKAELILGNPPADWFEQVPASLQFWQLDSAGFDQYKEVQLDEKVRVANMGDWFARPCAETIVGGVLALYRGLDTLTLLKEKAEWVGASLRPQLYTLNQQKAVVLGVGTIGTAVRKILEGFNCEVKSMARTSPEAELHSREELLAELATTDVVFNTLPGTAQRLVDEEFLSAMKKGSVYANVGRGNTTDEAALRRALESGHLYGAVLDVTEVEPLPADSPLWQMPRVVLTQHTGGGQARENDGKVALFIRNVNRFSQGETLESAVDLQRGY